MARVDYYLIEKEIQRILTESLINVSVTIETDHPVDSQPWVAVYLERRETPPDQPIAAGQRTRFSLRFSIWCWTWSLESGEVAAQARDDLIGQVEIALMNNRKIGTKVLSSYLQGGEMLTDKYQSDTGSSFYSGGEVVLIAEVIASV